MTDQFNLSPEHLTLIKERATGRFNAIDIGGELEQLKQLADDQLHDVGILFLKRVKSRGLGKRTLLVATLPKSALSLAIKWAAEVRDELLEPETADLFLFLDVIDITIDDVARIEADESFCRKFVKRPNESFSAMLDRSLLAPIYKPPPDSSNADDVDANKPTTVTTLRDPLVAALSVAAQSHSWFDQHQQDVWRSALLSGITGSDLAMELMNKTIPEANTP